MSDTPAMCTTNGKPVEDVRANQTNETGQHDGYIVLCPDERAKGFTRPYRDSYRHVGKAQQLEDGRGAAVACGACWRVRHRHDDGPGAV